MATAAELDVQAREHADLKRVARLLERLTNHRASGGLDREVVEAAAKAAVVRANTGSYEFVGSAGGFTWKRR